MTNRFSEMESPLQFARQPILWGIAVVAVFFGLFGIWAVVAPIDSAALAPGTIVVSTSRKTIQHLEGGIIREILVKDGQRVSENQVLLVLQDTAVKANMNMLEKQYYVLKIKEARLLAERDGELPVFPMISQDMIDVDELKKVIAVEREQFYVRRTIDARQDHIFSQKILQYREEINAIEAQQQAAKERLKVVSADLMSHERLLQRGYVSQKEVSELRQRQSELEGQIGANAAAVAKSQQAIVETQTDQLKYQTERRNEVIASLQETQVQLTDLSERLTAARDSLERTVIRAPYSGIVTGLKFHAMQGVIPPGEPILDIVPQNEELIIEAMVKPEDVDVVHVGLTAMVRLSAFKSKDVPRLEGKVIYVSADRFTEPNSGMPYFVARVRLNEQAMMDLKGQELSPGMSAEVFIITGARSLVRYLVDPLTAALFKTFREQ